MILFKSILLLLHVTCAHWACWGPLLAAICSLQTTGGAPGLGRYLTRCSLIALLLAAGIGLLDWALVVWVLPESSLATVFRAMPTSRYGWLAAEWGVSCGLLGLAWWGWGTIDRGRFRRWGVALLLGISALNLGYHFPVFFTACQAAAQRVQAGSAGHGQISELAAMLQGTGFKKLRFSPAVLALSLHHVVAGIAWAGILLAELSGHYAARRQLDPAPWIRWGARLALGATLLQILVGLWTMSQQTPLGRDAMLGGQWFATGWFAGGIAAALVLLHQLATLTLEPGPGQARKAAWWWAITTLAMFNMTSHVRGAG